MHAAYYHREFPTPAIVIKGVSDPSNKSKDSLDRLGHWRMLAKENPVRLALAMIRCGRFRPLETDQYEIDFGYRLAGRGAGGLRSGEPRHVTPRLFAADQAARSVDAPVFDGGALR
jgi:hypothetical protein